MKSIFPAVFAFTIIFTSYASAQPTTPSQPTDRAWGAYARQLQRDCPTKQLDQLKPADLRDALDRYKDRQTAKVQKQMSQAEAQSCEGSLASASCANIGDIRFASQKGKIAPLAQDICQQFSALPQ